MRLVKYDGSGNVFSGHNEKPYFLPEETFLYFTFFTLLSLLNVREYFLRMRANVTPIVTIEMEMSRIVEVVNIDVSEQNNTIGNNNWISLDIKESIRLVVLKESLEP